MYSVFGDFVWNKHDADSTIEKCTSSKRAQLILVSSVDFMAYVSLFRLYSDKGYFVHFGKS